MNSKMNTTALKRWMKTLVILNSLMAVSSQWLPAQDNGGASSSSPSSSTENEDGGAQPQRPPAFLAVLDTDHDGVISKRELRRASDALLTFDTNGDGELTLEEIQPASSEEESDDEGEDSRRDNRHRRPDQRGFPPR